MLHSQGTGFNLSLFFSLIRALFPRWNFFDQVAYQFAAEVKVESADSWHRVSFHQKRTAWSLFVNPQLNLALAQVNVIEHFAQDLQKIPTSTPQILSKTVQSLTSYQLLKTLLSNRVPDLVGTLPARFQFRIVAYNSKEVLEVYISDPILLEAS